MWEVRIYLGRDPETGRKRYTSRTVRGPKREAERVCRDLVIEVEPAGSYTFTPMQVSEVSGSDAPAVASAASARVAVVAGSLIDVDVASDLAELFRLLGDPTRVRILYALLEAGELCVCDLAEVVGTSDTKVSQALRLLRGAGAVRNRRDGRNVYYRLDDAHVRILVDVSREHVSHQHRDE